MDFLSVAFPVLVSAIAVLSRAPFMNFPIDEDFAYYIYRATFARKGIKWKEDVFIHYPVSKMIAFDALYGADPKKGVFRIRVFYALMHVVTSLVIYAIVNAVTGSPHAALFAGVLYAFFGGVPSLCAQSANFEQVYLPFVLLGAFLMWGGGQWAAVSGLLFGMAIVIKFPTGIYIPVLGLAAWYGYGFWQMVFFVVFASVPPVAALLADYFMGYLDAKARSQFKTRLAISMRLPALKKIFGSRVEDFKLIFGQTLPLWLFGVPTLLASLSVTSLTANGALWPAVFTAVTISMIPLQYAYSRYHYIPVTGVLAIATGIGAYRVASMGGVALSLAASVFVLSLVYSLKKLYPFYARPLSSQTLAKYDKYDQYIYLPRAGKLIGKIARFRGEEGRIFVWGSFTHIHIYADIPSSDGCVSYGVGPWDAEALEGYFDSIIGGLIRHRPPYLVRAFADLDMKYLEEVTGLKYRLVKVLFARLPLYRLESSPTPSIDPLSLPWQEKMRIFTELTRGVPLSGVNTADGDRGQYRTAIKECRKTLFLNPDDAEVLSYLGLLYYETGMAERAAGVFEEIIKKFPSRRDARPMLARHRIGQGKLEEAEKLISEEIRIFGNTSGTRHFSGVIYGKKGMYGAAVKEFEKLSDLSPENAEFLIPLAGSYIALGDVQKALRLYERAFATASGPKGDNMRSRAVCSIADIMASEKNPQSMTIKDYMKKDPQNVLLKYAFASALLRESNVKGASETAREIFTEIAGNSADPNTRGAALFRLACLMENNGEGNAEDKMKLLSKCIRLNPYHLAAREMLKKLEADHACA